MVYKRYLNQMRPETPHLLFSVTKSFTGLLAAQLAHEGKIDPDALVRLIAAVQIAMISAKCPSHSLEDFVRTQQQRLRDREPKRIGSLHVDHEFVAIRPLDRQVGGSRAAKNQVDVLDEAF